MPDSTPSAAPATSTGSAVDPAAARSGSEPVATIPCAGPPPALDAVVPLVPAGRYELGAEIARGGMGAVYRATDTAFGREVAVKVLLGRFGAGSGAARRFADEARITGQLQHPAIPPVHDVGTLPDGRTFLAMKLIKGETLDDQLKARPDPSFGRGRFVAAFEQVCQAVAYAHAHKVIHRDLKPGNIMVGAFGEVQVMDWGLAKVLGSHEVEAADPDEPAGGTAIESLRTSESALTRAGSVMGTPAYMPPEQALGAVHKVDERSDVFGLGAILAVILTGRPPFVGSSLETTHLLAAQGSVEECFARLDASGAEPEMVALCKRCLSKKPGDRPADAGEVARAVAALRAAADERARQAELDRVKAEGDRATAETKAAEERNTRREVEARVGAERARADEQRKRRRVQLVLAGFVVLAATGGGAAAYRVQHDRWAAEKQQADERFTAEQKRQEDLRAADRAAAAKQRAVRADALVQALGNADTGAVKPLLDDLVEFRDLTGPKLRELAERPPGEKPGLHARLALLPLEPQRALELSEYLLTCRPNELQPICAALGPHAGEVWQPLWLTLASRRQEPGERLRAACALAALAPRQLGPKRWRDMTPDLVDVVTRTGPGEFVAWATALEPVREYLVPVLLRRYPELRRRIAGGKLDVPELVATATAYDLTADMLARYATAPADLAELALLADPRHYSQFAGALSASKAVVVPLLKGELAKKPPEGLPVDKLDAVLEAHGKRRGYAAAALVALGEAESAWPVFGFPTDGDPTTRSYLQERLTAVGADPVALVKRFGAEADVSAKRALLIALGDFPAESVPAGEREPFLGRLLELYREHPDSGLHGAIDWLLRQKWGKGQELAAIDAGLARVARGKVAARAVMGAAVPVGVPGGVVGPQLPAPVVAVGKDWFVNGEGQTFAVVRGPVEFTLGSPLSEPGRIDLNEPLHRKQIPRTFAIATKEVTVEQFLRFLPKHYWLKSWSPELDTPAVSMTWYEAAEYCNWLSAQEGISSDQWCYEPNNEGRYGEGMRMKLGHLSLAGYRLPTEVEWECACRSGAGTARYFGRGGELLPRYGWFLGNAEERAWSVGQKRPNECGLFDALGNALEWSESPALVYATAQKEDTENAKQLLIDERVSRLARGGSFLNLPAVLRVANRNNSRPGNRLGVTGFRPARTLP